MPVADSFNEVIAWAITPYYNGLTYPVKKTPELTISKQRDVAQKKRKSGEIKSSVRKITVTGPRC